MKTIGLCILSFCVFGLLQICGAASNDVIEAQKVVVGDNGAGVYTIKVGYRAVGENRAFNIKIIDSLPKTLDLVSGKLVLKGEEPSSEWTWNVYQVKARNIDFTLNQLSTDVELPPARVVFSRNNVENSAEETLETESQTVTVSLVIPQGKVSLMPVIAFFVLVFPVVVAVYAIPYYGSKATQKKKKKQ
eukprot:TRINITY_DN18977_c1_g1_i1.p1 TRINITY_DN18977_c1_g1~~TRINITY_DN18977_c1_g1_i1.p1  ORF type:complete len:189 (-),score=35.62 TRINITY_DN18977_c1_g1_i1:73-639(-)